jgi:hypothetical protein
MAFFGEIRSSVVLPDNVILSGVLAQKTRNAKLNSDSNSSGGVASAPLRMAAARLFHPVQIIEIRGDHRHHDECGGQNAPGDCHGG